MSSETHSPSIESVARELGVEVKLILEIIIGLKIRPWVMLTQAEADEYLGKNAEPIYVKIAAGDMKLIASRARPTYGNWPAPRTFARAHQPDQQFKDSRKVKWREILFSAPDLVLLKKVAAKNCSKRKRVKGVSSLRASPEFKVTALAAAKAFLEGNVRRPKRLTAKWLAEKLVDQRNGQFWSEVGFKGNLSSRNADYIRQVLGPSMKKLKCI